MIKNSRAKKAVAGIVSAAMLASTIPSLSIASNVAAADHENYAEALELGLYFYDANQCGCEVDDNCLTWRGNCHTYDAEASLNNTTGLSSDAKAVIQSQNGGKDTVDVSGGYHDAGDHVKFNLTMGFNSSSLGWAYYAYPEAFKDTGTEGHLFYIMRETADYLMKVTYLDDNGDVAAICQTVSDESDHNYWQSPEVQTYNRPTYWFSGSTINNHVCDMMVAALAATAVTFDETDPSYAAECLKYADAIYNYSRKYTGTNGDGMGNMYKVGDMAPASSKAWGEAWLYLADSSTHSLPTAKPTSNGCYNGSDYDYWIYGWGKQWGGYACLMSHITGDSAYINEVKFNVDQKDSSQYIVYSDWGSSRYNCSWQAYALTYGELANNQTYLDNAAWQMDYLLGNNPTGYSFLIGYGDKYPTHIHHRAANPGNGDPAQNPEAKYTLYGSLVGGPSDSNGTYSDATNSYAHTEMALDYNACFMVAIAGLYSAFGGDTTTAQPIIDAATEIKSDFDFGDETVEPTTPEPTTEAVECTVTVSVVDEETGEYIPGAEVLMETEGEAVVWNTSDENPKTIVACTSIDENVSYQALLRSFPEGYVEAPGNNYYIKFSEDSTTAEIIIKLTKVQETTPEPTTEPETAPETTEPVEEKTWGDANCDGDVLVNDVILVMSYAANPDKSEITAEGIANADVYQNGDGLAVTDATAIQKYLTKLISTLPES